MTAARLFNLCGSFNLDGRCPLRSLPADATFKVGRTALVYERRPSNFPHQATFVMQKRKKDLHATWAGTPKTLRVFSNGLVQFHGANDLERALQVTRALSKYVYGRCRHHKRFASRKDSKEEQSSLSVLDAPAKLSMVNAVSDIGQPVRLRVVEAALRADGASFKHAPRCDGAPIVSARHRPTGVMMMFYSTGKVICSGGHTLDAVMDAINNVAVPLALRASAGAAAAAAGDD
jgi:hypothetical protein